MHHKSVSDEIVRDVFSSGSSVLPIKTDFMPNPKKILKVVDNPVIQQVGGILALGLIVYGIAYYFSEEN